MRVEGFAPGGTDRHKFEQALPEFYRLLWRVGIDTGLRIGDLLEMRIGDLASFCDGCYVTEQKTGKARKVRLTAAVASAVMAAASGRDESDFLWESPMKPGQPIARQSVWRAFRRAERAAGVKKHVGTHSARKTYAQALYKRYDLETVQEVLRHRYPSTTLFYVINPRTRGPSERASAKKMSPSTTKPAPKARKPRRESGGARPSFVTRNGEE